MEIKVTKKLGENTTVEFKSTEPEFKKAMCEIVPFTQPDYCSLCKSTKIMYETNKSTTDKGTFIYIKRRCLQCQAQSTLGEYKGGGYFWKAFEIYQPKEQGVTGE